MECQWVPSDERTPRERDFVLVIACMEVTGDWKYDIAILTQYGAGHYAWQSSESTYTLDEVRFWMPLPPPPSVR